MSFSGESSRPAFSGAGPGAPSGVPPPGPRPNGPPGSDPEGPSGQEVWADGRYERRALLGAGGMGRVTLAWDRVVGREVALKEVFARDEAHREALTQRLLREAAVTARLEHPGIVAVYDVGRSAHGPFYTMRVVRGRALSERVRDAGSAAERLALLRNLLSASEALAFAHEHGVIHRDVKPSNIMVGEFGETVLMDWGLAGGVAEVEPPAAPVAHAPLVSGALTAVGAVIGTPQYLSPEQARGHRADARSDVFALGLALYEVVTGAPAREQETPPERSAEEPVAELPALRDAPPELRAIIARATARRPEDRYTTAKALAADLGAFLDGRRVGAYAYSNVELLRRLVRAWRAPLLVLLGALVVGSTLLGLAFRQVEAARERAEADRSAAERSAARATAAEADTQGALRRAEQALATAIGERLVAGRSELDDAASGALAAEALSHGASPDAVGVLAELAASAAPVPAATYRLPDCLSVMPLAARRALVCWGLGGVALWELAPLRRVWFVLGELAPSSLLERQGLVAGTALRTGRTRLFRLDTGEAVDALPSSYAFTTSPLSEVALQTGTDALRLFDGRRVTQTLPLPCPLNTAAVGAEEAWLVACTDGRLLSGRGPAPGPGSLTERQLHAVGFAPYAAALLPEVGTAVLGSNKGQLAVVDLATGEPRRVVGGATGLIHGLDTSPDGRFACGLDEVPGVLVWDLLAGAVRARLPKEESVGAGFSLGAGPSVGRSGAAGASPLLTWGRDTLTEWTLPAARPRALEASGGVTDLDVDEARGRLVVAAAEAVSVLDLGSGAPLARAAVGGVARRAVGTPDGDVVLTVPGPQAFWRWRARRAEAGDPAGDASAFRGAPERLTNDEPFIPYARGLESLPGGRLLHCPDYGRLWITDGTARVLWRDDVDVRCTDSDVNEGGTHAVLLDGPTGALRWVALGPAPASWLAASEVDWRAVAVSPDGDAAACAGVEAVDLVDAGGQLLGRLETGSVAPLSEVEWSPTGRWLAAGGRDGTSFLWELDPTDGAWQTARLRARFRAQHERVSALAFPMDEAWLAIGSWDRSVRFYALDAVAQRAPGGSR